MGADGLPRGIVLPLITPFDEAGEVDVPMLRRLTDFYVSAEVQAIFAIGSAGQGLVMTPDQRRLALDAVVDVAGGRIPVIAHVGTADSYTGRELACHAARAGAMSIAIVPPYYYSDHTAFEIVRHFCEIADAAPDLPVVVYDNPKYSGIQLTLPLLASLRDELPSIAGIKTAYATTEHVLACVAALPGVRVYSGSIRHLVDTVGKGVAGAINPPSSVFPELSVELWRALCEGREADARLLQQRVNALSDTVAACTERFGRGAIAEVLRMRGFDVVRYPRWTTHAFTAGERQQLRDALVAAGAKSYLAA